MTLIDELFSIEREAGKNSPIHDMDARIKLIICICGLLGAVFMPYTGTSQSLIPWETAIALLALFVLFTTIYLLSGATLRYYLLRLCLILPFGILVIVLQPFFFNPYYDVYHAIFTLGPVSMYWESLVFAILLLAKLIISVSFIILLSATTTSQEMIAGATRMHLPRIFATVLTLTIRYLYVFAEMFRKIILSYSCRGFEHWGRGLPLRYRLHVIGNGAGTIFVRSLEQGERTYTSMCCRGYSPEETSMYITKKPILAFEWLFLVFCIGFIVLIPLAIYLIF
ncbi:MAG TPA: energy-coupling factor transporter transmembrane component T [Methanocorpusculum sp.]|nr:energy-coupling factor transporter transmembrane component T [Methanocorpusculum sp.]